MLAVAADAFGASKMLLAYVARPQARGGGGGVSTRGCDNLGPTLSKTS